MSAVVRRFACWLDREIDREAANWFEGLSDSSNVLLRIHRTVGE